MNLNGGHLLLLAILSPVIAVLIVLFNAIIATETGRGEPYTASYSYCARRVYLAKSQSYCGETKTGHEKRVDVFYNGPLWNFTGYKVVQ